MALLALACGSSKRPTKQSSEAGAPSGGAGDPEPNQGGDPGTGGNTQGGTTAVAGAPTTEAGSPAGGVGGEPNVGELVVISGKVVAFNEEPVPGRVVEVEGQEVTTGADGSFEAVVTMPYDVVLRGELVVGQVKRTLAYLDVTQGEIKLYDDVGDSVSLNLGGQLGGIDFPIPDGDQVFVAVDGPLMLTQAGPVEPPSSFFRLQPDSQGTFAGSALRWYGPNEAAATLFGLRFSGDQVTAFASKPVTLALGEELTSPEADLTLTLPVPRSFKLNVTQAAEPLQIDCTISVRLADIRLFETAECSPGEVEISVPSGIPDELPLRVVVEGELQYQYFSIYRQLSGSVASANVELPAEAPGVLTPPVNAEGAASSLVFRFAPLPSMVTRLDYDYPFLAPTGQQYYVNDVVFTHNANVPLSRLLELGLELPAEKVVSWRMRSLGEATDVDALLAPERAARAFHSSHSGNYLGESSRHFKYQPD